MPFIYSLFLRGIVAAGAGEEEQRCTRRRSRAWLQTPLRSAPPIAPTTVP